MNRNEACNGKLWQEHIELTIFSYISDWVISSLIIGFNRSMILDSWYIIFILKLIFFNSTTYICYLFWLPIKSQANHFKYVEYKFLEFYLIVNPNCFFNVKSIEPAPVLFSIARCFFRLLKRMRSDNRVLICNRCLFARRSNACDYSYWVLLCICWRRHINMMFGFIDGVR